MLSLIPKVHAISLIANCPDSSSQTGGSTYFSPLCPITNTVPLSVLVDNVISLILFLAGALAVIYLLWSGISYITAGEDDTKAATARKGIINAIIGIIIIVLAFVIEKAAARLFL